MQTVTIDFLRLQKHLITVEADSMIDMLQHRVGSEVWFALLVDGTYYDLVRVERTYHKPVIIEAMKQALNLVRGAVISARLAASESVSVSERTYVVRYTLGKARSQRKVLQWAGQAESADDACQQVRRKHGNQIVILSAR